jgi:gliding motility-associated-like protein
MHYVYIIYSISCNTFYKGYSANPKKRLLQHNNGEAVYTRRTNDWKLVYIEIFNNKSDALKRESNQEKINNNSEIIIYLCFNMLFARYIFLALFVFTNLTIVLAQNQLSNSGKEFWLAFGNNNSIPNSDLRLYITSNQNTTVRLTTIYSNSIHNITQNQTTEIVLSAALYSNSNNVNINNTGIRITSQNDITVFASNVQPATTDATMVLPKSALGKSTEYLINRVQAMRNSGVLFVANEDSTKIIIENATVGLSEITLNKFQTYSLPYSNFQESLTARSGNLCKPFSVFFFNECTTIGGCPACDHLYTQVLPNSKLGKNYILSPFLNQTSGYVYSVLGTVDSTTFQINGGQPIKINKGQRLEYNITNPTTLCLNASQPISVFQTMKGVNCNLGSIKLGDPAIVQLNANNQMIPKATFSSLTGGNIRQHYVNIIVDSSSKNNLFIDNKLANKNKFIPVDSCSNYIIYRDSLSAGTHTIECQNGFIAYAYGLTTAESYLFSVGSSFENQNYNFEITAPSQCVGDTIRVKQTGIPLRTVRFIQGNFSDSGSMAEYVMNIPGTYTIKMIAETFENDCPDTIIKTIQISKPKQIFPNDTNFCKSYSNVIRINKDDVSQYSWNIVNYNYDTLLIDKEGLYIVNITDQNKCKYSDTFNLEKTPLPTLNVSLTGSICQNDTLKFINNSPDSIGNNVISYTLMYKDSILEFENKTVKIIGSDTGSNIFTLISSNSNKCKDSSVFSSIVLTKPQAQILSNNTTQCFKEHEFTFFIDSIIHCKQCIYYWDFGDGSFSQDNFIEKTYSLPGIYTVKLKVTHINTCIDSTFVNIEVNPNPIAEFSLNDSIQCILNNLFITNNTTYYPSDKVSYSWNFGDGSFDTTRNPVFSFNNIGNYSIILLAEGEKGCKDSTSKQVIIFAKPKASILTNNKEQCLNENQFKLEREDSSKIFLLEEWSFSNYNYSKNGPSLYISFTEPGTYIYNYFIADSSGCTDTIIGNLIVYPQANLDFTTDTVCFGEKTNIASNSSIESGEISSFEWDFGDGNFGKGENTSHIYTNIQSYTVTLKTETDKGCKDSLTKKDIVKILELPEADFSWKKVTDSLQSSKILFTDLSRGNTSFTYMWDLGLVGTYTDPNPLITFYDTANILVNLKIKDSFGCEGSVSKYIIVYPENSIYIPNAFSPNNSGLNDNFKPVGVVYPKTYLFQIFDRWGSEIFRTNEPNEGWDGTYNLSDMPEGVYMYRIWLISLQGQTQTYSGTVSLIR